MRLSLRHPLFQVQVNDVYFYDVSAFIYFKKVISKSRWQSGESDNLKRWYLKGQTDEPLGDTRFVFRISKYIIIIHIL